jgi:hypothetical protein
LEYIGVLDPCQSLIVWIPILQKDSFESAVTSAKVLNDDRIKHFYDTNRIVGESIAGSVRWRGQVAWDIYCQWIPGEGRGGLDKERSGRKFKIYRNRGLFGLGKCS